jgi:ABC-type uncharacterized transport system substrate-binding protein
LRAVLPKARTIAALYNPGNPSNLKFLEDLRVHAADMAITVTPVELRSPKDQCRVRRHHGATSRHAAGAR